MSLHPLKTSNQAVPHFDLAHFMLSQLSYQGYMLSLHSYEMQQITPYWIVRAFPQISVLYLHSSNQLSFSASNIIHFQHMHIFPSVLIATQKLRSHNKIFNAIIWISQTFDYNSDIFNAFSLLNSVLFYKTTGKERNQGKANSWMGVTFCNST